MKVMGFAELYLLEWHYQFYKCACCLLHCRGKMKCEGWLILTEDTLNWYDNNPDGDNNNPIHSCTFNSPKEAFVLLPCLDKKSLPVSTPIREAELTFGIQKHQSGTCDNIVFIARNVQSKDEWLKAIGNVLASHSIPQQMDNGEGIDCRSDVSPTTAKELKSVSIIPVRVDSQKSAIDEDVLVTPTPPCRRSKRNTSDRQDLDLSIRSSMFDSSPSDTSFI